jgi:hypothetical protein
MVRVKRWLVPAVTVPVMAVVAVAGPSWAATTPRTAQVAAPAPALPSSCSIHALPLSARHSQGDVTAADSTDRYVVGQDFGGAEVRSVVWHDARISAVFSAGVYLTGVNRAGTAVGVNARGEAVRVTGKSVRPLPGGAHVGQDAIELPSIPQPAINDDGVIAGLRTVGHRTSVLRWTSADRSPQVQPTVPGYPMVLGLDGIAADGTVLSELNPAPGHSESQITYVWPSHGAGYRLVPPRVSGTVNDMSIIGVSGDIVAVEVFLVGRESAPLSFLYHLSTRTFTKLAIGDVGVDVVNGRGWVTGWWNRHGEYFIAQGHRIRLPLLPSAAHRDDRLAPAVISDDGRIIVGTAWTPAAKGGDGPPTPVVWTCH